MIKFAGDHSAKIDDKGRVVFPYQLKAMLEEGGDLRFIIKKGIYSNSLEMYTYEEWIRYSEGVLSRLNLFNPKHNQFWAEFTNDRALVEPDEKIGRITIPKELLESIGATKELLFIGRDHYIAIWAKEDFDNSRLSKEEYTDLTQEILG